MELRVAAIDKLMDYAASGIGAIAGPMLAPWRARRESKVKLIQARAETDGRIMEAETEATTMKIIADAQAQAREQLLVGKDQSQGAAELTSTGITQKIEFQERKRLLNAREVIRYSAADLAGKDVDNHEPDPDWTARFFDCIQDVSSADMQRLWARLLSGEVRRPGNTSLRTMDTLRNMTKTEAEMFGSLCSFVLEAGLCIVFNEKKHVDQHPELSHVNLVLVQDYGLLEFGQSRYQVTNETSRFIYNGYMLIASGMGDKKITFNIATLTTAGAELYRISNPQPNDAYLETLAKYFHSNECRLSFAEILERHPDGSVRHAQFMPVL